MGKSLFQRGRITFNLTLAIKIGKNGASASMSWNNYQSANSQYEESF